MAKRATKAAPKRAPKAAAPAVEPAAVPGEPTMPEETAARLFDLPLPVVRSLSRRGILPRINGGKMPLARTIQNYIAYIREDFVTLEEAAAASGYSTGWIKRLIAEGYIKRIASGDLRRVDVFKGILAFKNDEDRRAQKVQAESRVKDARAAEIELRLAVRRRELIPFTDAEAGFAALCGMIRETLDGFPARITRDRALRAQIERETDDALRRISERAEAVGEALAAGREVFEAGD